MTTPPTTTAKETASVKNVPAIVWIAATVIAVSIIAGIVVLTVTGKPTDALTSFLTDKLLATITAVVTLYLAVKVKQVQTQTNGTTTTLTNINAQQSQALANSVPATAVLAPAVVAPAADAANVRPTEHGPTS
jgi:hypothetical protein